jgi:hypothetical protein
LAVRKVACVPSPTMKIDNHRKWTISFGHKLAPHKGKALMVKVGEVLSCKCFVIIHHRKNPYQFAAVSYANEYSNNIKLASN